MPGARPTGPQPVARLRRLTALEFSNSLRDLLGQEVSPSSVEPDQEDDGLYSVGASVVAVSPAGVARYEAAVLGATERALADATRAARVLACVPATMADTACATRAINALGRRAFRRPLTSAETGRFLGLAQAIAQEPGSSALVGMRHALMAILQSPSFLYRVELGAPSAPDGGRPKYTGFEMASRLASLLWGTVPDDALLDAAAADALSAPDGVRKQAERLLGHANARRALRELADDLYGLEHLDTAIKDTALYRAWTSTLKNAMREDLLRRVDDVVFGTPEDFLSLYDGRVVFVNNELGRLYGVPAQTPDGVRRAELPDGSPRRGLATSGAVLAAYGLPQRTSPTARGKFVAEVLLCKTVPLPPPEVDATLPPSAGANATLREQLDLHRMNPSCAGCHALMDPIGLGLENFDTVGAYRATERGRPIDASGELDGAPFRNAAELGARLRQHAEAGPCFASKLYAHAQGRAPIAVDGPAVEALGRRFAQGGRRADRLLVELAASEAFRFVEPLGR
jgi:PAS domain-containing protein